MSKIIICIILSILAAFAVARNIKVQNSCSYTISITTVSGSGSEPIPYNNPVSINSGQSHDVSVDDSWAGAFSFKNGGSYSFVFVAAKNGYLAVGLFGGPGDNEHSSPNSDFGARLVSQDNCVNLNCPNLPCDQIYSTWDNYGTICNTQVDYTVTYCP